MPLKDQALHLAALGYRVFPLERGGKRPIVAEWQKRATTDPATIEAWWAEAPEANIGIATGHGLVVLDCDCKDGRDGLGSLALLDMMGLPPSMRVRTVSGGVHVYLACSSERFNSVDRLDGLPGIDVRGDGGFVVAPGSVVDGRKYEVIG